MDNNLQDNSNNNVEPILNIPDEKKDTGQAESITQGVQPPLPEQTSTNSNTSQNSGAESGKLMGVLSYLGFLALIPYFGEKNNPFVVFHAKQGMNLLIIEIIVPLILGAASYVLPLGLYLLLRTISSLLSVGFLVLCIIGIVNVCGGKMKELPIVGSIKIIK